MKFPKRLSLNDAIYCLAIEREDYKPPKGLDTYSGPLLEVLDALEERYETQLCRNPSLKVKVEPQLGAIEELRKLVITIEDEIMDNASQLSAGDADIDKLMKNRGTPYISRDNLLQWALSPPLNIKVRGMENLYKRLAEKKRDSSQKANTVEDNAELEHADQPSNWNGVTLELRAANKLRVIAKDYRKDHHLEGTVLLHKSTKELTAVGSLLLKIAEKGRIPNHSPGKSASSRIKTPVSKLKKALAQITGISAEPFFEFSLTDGWKPHFKMVDKRYANEERARIQATHVSFEDNRDSYAAGVAHNFADEDDPAGQFIRGEGHTVESTDPGN